MMTTTVTIKTVVEGAEPQIVINVGESAQKHVLRTFNVTANEKVDATKVLCAALIQQQLELLDKCEAGDPRVRAAWNAIELVEAAQMQCVKANFVQA